MSDVTVWLNRAGLRSQTVVADSLHSAMTVIAECQHSAANIKLKFWMIYDVDSPLRILVADCGHKDSVFLPFRLHSPSNR